MRVAGRLAVPLLALFVCVVTAFDVERLKGESFQARVLDSDDLWIIIADAPQCGEICDTVLAAVEKVQKNTGGVLRFGVINVLEHVEADGESMMFGEMYGMVNQTSGTVAIPSMMIHQYGPKVAAGALMMPPEITSQLAHGGAKLLWKQLKQFVPSMTSSVGSQARLDEFLNQDARLPHAILFTKKLGTSAVYKKLSVAFHRRAVFAEVSQHIDELVEQFGVTEYPTLVLSPAGGKGGSWDRYEGPLKHDEVEEWLDTRAPTIPAPLVTSSRQFDQACTGQGGICYVAVVGSGGDRAAHLDTFRAVASRSYVRIDVDDMQRGKMEARAIPAHFLALPGADQEAFMSTFQVDAPALVVLNPRKKLFSTMKASFSKENLREFVVATMHGSSASFEKFSSMPAIANVDGSVEEPAPLPTAEEARGEAAGSDAASAGGGAGGTQLLDDLKKSKEEEEGTPRPMPKRVTGKKKMKRKVKKKKKKKAAKSDL